MEKLRDIQKCYFREDIFEELRKHNEAFDLEKFYIDNIGFEYVLQTGFRLISRNQMIDCFCLTSKHEHIIENILLAMFDDYNDVYSKNNYEWRKTCMDFGVISFQLISNYYTLIWVPSKINEFQYNALLETFDSITQIQKKYPIEVQFFVSFFDEIGGFVSKPLEEAISYLKAIVSDDEFCYDEYMMVDSKKLVKDGRNG